MEFNFIQISDLHLFADKTKKLNGITTFQSLKAILNDTFQKKLIFDFICVTGDVTEAGEGEAYLHAYNLLKKLEKPIFWIPGNHDSLNIMKTFSEKYNLSLETAFTHKNWQFILLNSLVEGKSYGQLSESSVQLLKNRLQECDYPTVVALHHNPVATNTTWADRIMLQKSEGFLKTLQAYPQVKAVLYGHIHKPYQTLKQGIQFFSAPSTCFHIQHGLPHFEIEKTSPGYYEFQIKKEEIIVNLRKVNIEEVPSNDYH